MSYAVLVNGRGNAWPIEVGAPCCPGSRSAALGNDLREYANTSFSIVRESVLGDPEWSVLVDIGMGVIPALVQHGNRLLDAVILTHPHMDHIAGLDWLIANNGRYGKGVVSWDNHNRAIGSAGPYEILDIEPKIALQNRHRKAQLGKCDYPSPPPTEV